MWKKFDNMRKIVESGLMVIIRTDNEEEARKIADACIEGGVCALEITTGVPNVLKIIESLAQTYSSKGILIGAGTVLDAETARSAMLAGAEFLVSPNFDADMVRMCNRYQIVSVIGTTSTKEVLEAMEAGADFIKLFPAEILGPQYVKSLRAPLPQVPFVPAGKVTPETVPQWLQAGCVALAAGSYITGPAKKGDYQRVTQASREIIAAIAAARKQLS